MRGSSAHGNALQLRFRAIGSFRVRHASLHGVVAFHLGLVQALSIPATHRPMEHKFGRCSRVRLMFKSSIGGPDPDVPDSEIKNAQYNSRRLDESSVLTYDASGSFPRFSAQLFLALVG